MHGADGRVQEAGEDGRAGDAAVVEGESRCRPLLEELMSQSVCR